MDYKDLEKQREQLDIQGESLETTEQWWANIISLKISEHTYLKEKLINKWNEEDFNRMSQLEKDIEHLQKKAGWEQREMSKYQEKCKNFEKIKEKIKLIEFTKSLNKINRIFHKDPPNKS